MVFNWKMNFAYFWNLISFQRAPIKMAFSCNKTSQKLHSPNVLFQYLNASRLLLKIKTDQLLQKLAQQTAGKQQCAMSPILIV